MNFNKLYLMPFSCAVLLASCASEKATSDICDNTNYNLLENLSPIKTKYDNNANLKNKYLLGFKEGVDMAMKDGGGKTLDNFSNNINEQAYIDGLIHGYNLIRYIIFSRRSEVTPPPSAD